MLRTASPVEWRVVAPPTPHPGSRPNRANTTPRYQTQHLTQVPDPTPHPGTRPYTTPRYQRSDPTTHPCNRPTPRYQTPHHTQVLTHTQVLDPTPHPVTGTRPYILHPGNNPNFSFFSVIKKNQNGLQFCERTKFYVFYLYFICKNQTFQIIFVLICSLINETSANT